LPSLPGLRVRSILPFFSGDGVRDLNSSAGLGVSVDVLTVLDRLFSLIEPVAELFRGAIAGRYGRGGGRPRSAYSKGGIEPPPSQPEDPFVSLEVRGAPCAGGVGASTFRSGVGEARLSLDSSRLLFRASNSSTLSLHCSSSCRIESTRAFSVEDVGR
jgi:hypothetical protein